MLRISSLVIFFLTQLTAPAQDTITIEKLMLTTSLVRQSLFRSTAAAAIIDSSQISAGSVSSPVTILNSVAGVRMEERSPGSYRLSLRGSLLRSPFGVRNVKVYFNEFPLTDAGGNTYLNVIPLTALRSIDILKGPDGSLFGANSGGVVTLHSIPRSNKTGVELTYGSYGLFKASLRVSRLTSKNTLNISQDFQRSDGYRENSRLRRWFLQVDDEFKYSAKSTLSASAFYADLFYQTPGGLTLAQYDSNSRQARQATATLPGAVAQRAAVYNRMLFMGISNSTLLTPDLEHVFSVFGSSVDFKNPFITNYEQRRENNFGFRTYITVSSRKTSSSRVTFDYTVGVEWQNLYSSISNYRNEGGLKAALVSRGKIRTDQQFIFNRLKLNIDRKLTVEAGISLNYYRLRFTDSSILNNRFKPQWMPRVAVNYLVTRVLTFRGTISKGYSPPTTAEIRPPDNNFYRDLQAEKGLNFETGARFSHVRNRVWLDVSAFLFNLEDAIVRQQDSGSAEFFVNAGNVKQRGLELQAGIQIIDSTRHGFIKNLKVLNGSTINNFKFGRYETATGNFSGKLLTGVPKRVFVTSLFTETRNSVYFYLQHNYTGRLPLKDSNEFFARSYHLWVGKVGYRFLFEQLKINISAGVDNISNERYSLGNDLDAAGNRFYNAAPGRNYFLSLVVNL